MLIFCQVSQRNEATLKIPKIGKIKSLPHYLRHAHITLEWQFFVDVVAAWTALFQTL